MCFHSESKVNISSCQDLNDLPPISSKGDFSLARDARTSLSLETSVLVASTFALKETVDTISAKELASEGTRSVIFEELDSEKLDSADLGLDEQDLDKVIFSTSTSFKSSSPSLQSCKRELTPFSSIRSDEFDFEREYLGSTIARVYEIQMLWSRLVSVRSHKELTSAEKKEITHLVQERKKHLKTIKDIWNDKVLAGDVSLQAQIRPEFTLTPIDSGCGGAYYVKQSGVITHVIKPLDEDIFCINNRKGYANISEHKEMRIREGIPLYQSHLRDVAAYKIAKVLGLDSITPETTASILKSNEFYNFQDTLGKKDEDFSWLKDSPSHEKLCTVQKFVPDANELMEVYKTATFDQDDFEKACLLLWITGETDGHFGNFLSSIKKYDEEGNPIHSIIKVDNGLCLPEKNGEFTNHLLYLPNATYPISPELRKTILEFDGELVVNILKDLGLENTVDACRERIRQLKNTVRNAPFYAIEELFRKDSSV